MSQVTLEAVMERLEKLEQTVNRLLQNEGNHVQATSERSRKEPESVEFKDWRNAVAYAKTLPAPDPVMEKQFQEVLRELREADHRAAINEEEREEAERGGGS